MTDIITSCTHLLSIGKQLSLCWRFHGVEGKMDPTTALWAICVERNGQPARPV